MSTQKIQILSQEDIQLTLRRMAYQVMEFFYGEKNLTLVGIESGGAFISDSLNEILKEISDFEIQSVGLQIDKENPLQSPAIEVSDFEDQNLLLIDDVANSGSTLAFALKPFLDIVPRNIKIAVLVDRKHKRFPVTADIVGKKLSTNLSDTVIVEFDKNHIATGAYLVDK